ncbi:MAG: virulence RhuM family protein [Prevotella sp.]|nr:virulence RhuM family protein [Prevotella sp.]
MELFDASRQDVSYHINQIYAENEQDPERTRIFITSIDYDPNANLTRKFFATVQNKLHYAAHQHTAAEVIYERVDAEKPMVGMTNFKGD